MDNMREENKELRETLGNYEELWGNLGADNNRMVLATPNQEGFGDGECS
jgi:hypothetical protein